MGDRPSSFARSRQNALPRQPQQEQLFDTHPEVSLDFEIVRQAAHQRYSRPFLIIDTAIVRGKVRRFRATKADAKQYLRIAAPNIGSDWPLSGKFGAGAADAREIVALAAKRCTGLAGVTFNVGSQGRNPGNWRVALEKARALFEVMSKAGLKPRLLNIGGGFPVRHVKPIPSVEVIGEVVNECLKAFPEDVQVIAEPGRFLVSDAGYFVCRVLGTATRAGKRWMHWDAGLFGGVIESSEGLKYRIRTERSGPDIPWTVGGPTCDSVDIVMRDEPLPSDLQEGDFVYIKNAGAYTTAYASHFNGFPLPEVRVFESKR